MRWLLLALLALACADNANRDRDGDGVRDTIDNCLFVANPDQQDCEYDGYGDACDYDLDQDGVVGVQDASLMRKAMDDQKSGCADFNSDGFVDDRDALLFRQFYGAEQGGQSALQSGLACADATIQPGDEPCR